MARISIIKCDRAAQQKNVLAMVMLGLHAVEALDDERLPYAAWFAKEIKEGDQRGFRRA